jgi:hypothetical protein
LIGKGVSSRLIDSISPGTRTGILSVARFVRIIADSTPDCGVLFHRTRAAIRRVLRLSLLGAISLTASQLVEPASGYAESPAQPAGSTLVPGTTAGRLNNWLDPLRSSSRKSVPSPSEELLSDDSQNGIDTPAERSSSIRQTSLPGPSGDSEDLLVPPAVPHSDSEVPSQEPLSDQVELHQPLTAERVFSECPPGGEPDFCWQILPKGLLYRTYIAGEREPRMQFVSMYDTRSKRQVWDATLGGRVGLLKLSDPSDPHSDAFQLDLDGAVFARVLPEEVSAMLEGSDYRVGLYGTWKFDRISYRAGYYHISAHVGDEFLIANPLFNRINYVRDSLLAGVSYDLTDVNRVYTEVGYAAGVQGGAKPLELQFGTEYTPRAQTPAVGAPFAAVNGHLREDFDFKGGVNVVAGWGWQGPETKRRLRLGLNYYNGPSLQYEFFDRWENLIGAGIWMDY